MDRTNRLIVLGIVVLLGVSTIGTGIGGAAADGGLLTSDSGTENETEDSPEDAFFEINEIETNTPITAGETIVVTLEIENVGDTTDETPVSFKLGPYLKDETVVEIEPGTSKTVTLTYVSGSDDDDYWDLTASTRDDTVETVIRIESPSHSSGSSGSAERSEGGFDVTGLEVDEPIKVGETLTATAEITNTGDAATEKRVWFELENRRFDERTVGLDPGESKTVSATYNSTVDDAGEWNLTAATPNDAAERSVRIAELESDFEISELEAPDSVTAGDVATVRVTVTNTGDKADEKLVWFDLEENVIDQERVELEPGESTTVELTYRSSVTYVGEWSASAGTPDDRETFSLAVLEQSTPTSESETATPEGSPSTPTETSTDEPSNGIGLAVALAALLSVAGILIGRRR